MATGLGFLGMGNGFLHDAGVLLALTVLVAGVLALILRTRGIARERHSAAFGPIDRMFAVLGALGGFTAYLCEPSSAHASRDLTLGGLAAMSWMLALLVGRLGRRRR